MHKPVPANEVRFGAVVLAAGCSRRMRRHKMLLPWRDGRTIIGDVVLRARASADRVIVVLGHEQQAIRDALGGDGGDGGGVDIIYNERYADGEMISSIEAGVAALPNQCGAFFIVLGDQPGVDHEVFRQLIRIWRRTRARVVSPTYRGRRGHPIFLSGECINDLIDLPDGETLKTYIARHADQTVEVEVDDPAVLADVDTPEQYERLIQQQNGSLSCPSEAMVSAD